MRPLYPLSGTLERQEARHICTSGPGLPLSEAMTSQHLQRGCGPGWTPGLCSELPILGHGLETSSLLSSLLYGPPWDHPPLVPRLFKTPEQEGGSPWKPPSALGAQSHLSVLASGHSTSNVGDAPLVCSRSPPIAPCPHPRCCNGPPRWSLASNVFCPPVNHCSVAWFCEKPGLPCHPPPATR